MPIYGDKLTSTQYKLVKKISVNDFKSLLKTFKKSKSTFPYKNNYYFLKTIELDEAGKSVRYYSDKALIDVIFDQNYRENLKKKFPYISKFYNDPKYAIDDCNYMIMMESLIKESNRNLPKSSKYMFDICGNWTNGKVIIMEKK